MKDKSSNIDYTWYLKSLLKLIHFLELWTMETRSPWSTPTQSEIGEAESQLKYLTDVNVKLRADSKLMIREMGDGEPAEAIFMV